MTKHSVATFFENDDLGYIIATDSRVGAEKLLCYSPKAFFGKNHIGFIMGEFPSPKVNIEDSIKHTLNSLNNTFDDIEEGKVYADNDILNNSDYYIQIAHRGKDELNMFWFSNIPGISLWEKTENNTIYSNNTLTKTSRESEKGSSTWIAEDCSPHAGFIMGGNYYSLDDAVERVKMDVTKHSRFPDRDMGKPNVYVVSFNRLEQIE